MHINDFPDELLSYILEEATSQNVKEGVLFTYGLTQAPLPISKTPLSRYVRGPVQPEALRWDGASSMRQVCRKWHDWAIRHSMRNVSVRRWRGSERWAEISTRRRSYGIYELIERPTGSAVYRDPFGSLKGTVDLLSGCPDVAKEVRRMFFDGFYTVQTDRMIFAVLRSCRHLSSISVPWTLLRHGTATDWIHLLGISSSTDVPLKSLELRAVCMPSAQAKDWNQVINTHPLTDSRVDFSRLTRLKIFGNSGTMPINDEDMINISRTATSLEEFHLTNLSTVTIAGVMAIVKASQSSLRVLEHSPRSDDGFFHPHPGHLSEHICATLINCPNLKDLSISVPTMCSHLFSNEDLNWEGECQVRALGLCSSASSSPPSTLTQLQTLLKESRTLMRAQERKRRSLDIELFFADCIFDPRNRVVHADFNLANVSSGGAWPGIGGAMSAKGPYGTTGVYGKDTGSWQIVAEDEFVRAVEKGWYRL